MLLCRNRATDYRSGWRPIALAALLGGVLLIASGASASAATIDVPQDFNTIQDAVNNADPGDTISINKAKRYEETVTVATNNLTIMGSTKGVVIDGGPSPAGYTVDVTADGFTLKNLRVQHGDGGVHCTGNGCSVRGVSIAGGDHGGDCVEIDGNGGKVIDSTLRPCGSDDAVEVDGNSFTISGNLMAQADGGCVDLSGDDGEITDNSIHNCEDNEAIYGSTINDTLIAHNRIAASEGEAIDVFGEGNRVIDNFMENIEEVCIRGQGNDNRYEQNTMEGCSYNGIYIASGDRVKVIGNSVLAANPGGYDCYDVNGGVKPVLKDNTADICDGGFEVSGENPQVIGNKGTRLGDDEGFDIDCSDQPGGAPEGEACATGVLRNNSASGNNNDDEGFDVSASSTYGEGFQIVGNTARNNNDGGFYLSVFGAVIEDNVSRTDGSESNEPSFEITGSGQNEVTGNQAFGSAENGFYVSSVDNTLRDNLAKGSLYDGFNVTGANAMLIKNDALGNHGDGIDINSANVTVTKNVAEGNDYVDCAKGAGGTIAASQGNKCADGSDFAVPGGID